MTFKAGDRVVLKSETEYLYNSANCHLLLELKKLRELIVERKDDIPGLILIMGCSSALHQDRFKLASQFKVGDRVRLISDYENLGYNARAGAEAVVSVEPYVSFGTEYIGVRWDATDARRGSLPNGGYRIQRFELVPDEASITIPADPPPAINHCRTWDGVPCELLYVTPDNKAVIRRLRLNCRNEQSGTELVPMKQLKRSGLSSWQ